ncbi:MAG TPA: NAD(P)/FAD-dependent oxidoreductase [Candidatus Bathyarchaeota archaeon]|nr:NAD(P)/FAD-dependent oxidoreductase [Candidatus Bathyarchaeota archaeon]
MSHTWDVVIVGAGSCGCIAAHEISRSGFEVLLLDMKPREKIGDKVCGDALGTHHLKRIGLDLPPEVVVQDVPGVDTYSPDRKTVFRVGGGGLGAVILDRYKFGQFLLNRAIDSGAELSASTRVLSPIIKSERVIGVKVHGDEVYAKIVLDCSGVGGVLRNRMPDGTIDKELKKSELVVAYREIREIKEDPPEYCEIYLDQIKYPKGYAWIFPHGDRTVNVGVGMPSNLNIKPREYFYRYVMDMPILKDSKAVEKGSGVVPTRRPMDLMVWNGIMFGGDAGFTVNPLHAGGIGSSMLSGWLMAKAAIRALSIEDYSLRGLWSYTPEYMQMYGAKQAALDIFRIFLQNTSNEELNYGMHHGIMKEDDVLKASIDGDLHLSITDKVKRVFIGLGKPNFLLELKRTADRMRDVKNLYLAYPETPEGYSSWLSRAKELQRIIYG